MTPRQRSGAPFEVPRSRDHLRGRGRAVNSKGRDNPPFKVGPDFVQPVLQLPIPECLGFLKDNAKLASDLHVHVCVLSWDCHPQELCVRYEFLRERGQAGAGDGRRQHERLDVPGDHWYEPVFVHVRQLPEDGQGMPLRVFPVVVRLQPLDACPCSRGHLGDCALAAGVEEVRPLIRDGESDRLALLRREPGGVVLRGDREGKVVKRGPEVVQAVTQHEAQLGPDFRYVADRIVADLPTFLEFHGERGVS